MVWAFPRPKGLQGKSDSLRRYAWLIRSALGGIDKSFRDKKQTRLRSPPQLCILSQDTNWVRNHGFGDHIIEKFRHRAYKGVQQCHIPKMSAKSQGCTAPRHDHALGLKLPDSSTAIPNLANCGFLPAEKLGRPLP